MRVLSVDTATEVCGIGLSVDGHPKVEVILTPGLTHTRILIDGIRSAMALAKWDLAELDALAVTRGPGSFTGLRIGISTMKGIALALGKPLIGVSSLEVLAAQAPEGYQAVCPMIDARRKEVYWALFRRSDKGLKRVHAEQVGTAADVAGQVIGACLFIGNGAVRYAPQLKAGCLDADFMRPVELNAPRPAMVAKLAASHMAEGLIEDIHRFKPVYLRKSDAELGGQTKGALQPMVP